MFLPANITLQFGDTGDFVTELQRRLSTIQLLSEMMVNGAYDGNTVNAVKSFQSMHGIR
ncbi:MAG: peptidoglycan-binding domain-containing protein, partial [Alphaproteobacteria bacterium]